MYEIKNPIYLMPILSLLVCYLVWRLKGRDETGRQVVVPEYEILQGLSPAEAGVLHDFKATDREVTATLVDLAIRGYICIHRIPRKHIFGHYYSYEFELLNDDVLGLRRHERALLDGLFGVASAKWKAKIHAALTNPIAKAKANRQYPATTKSFVGKRVALEGLGTYFYQYANHAKEYLYTNLNADGYFKTHPLSSGLELMAIGLLLVMASFFMKDSYFYSFLLSGMILIFFSVIMQARTRSGKAAKENVEGLIMYLKTAEQDRLKSTQGKSTAEYKEGGAKLFESYLPYSIALGLEKSWSNQFKHTYQQPVEWLGNKPPSEVINLLRSINISLGSDKTR